MQIKNKIVKFYCFSIILFVEYFNKHIKSAIIYTYSTNVNLNKKFLRLVCTLRTSLTWDKFSNNVYSDLLQNTPGPSTGKICTF